MRMVACALLVLAVTAAPATAGPADVAIDISNQIMSPFCDGVTLHDCPSQEALDLRAKIQRWASAGWSRERIYERLEAEFGAGIRAAPPARGAGTLAWVLPGLALLAGAGAAYSFARRWAVGSADAGTTPVVMSPRERARIDADLEALRGDTQSEVRT
ncbi:MAG: cytochrome c-type biogenesis protein CcmH [Actinobacteria bacterium]|nr:cytochrome c-type biogenesis protein CcmH [Actinomycetota bacterium]